jgi:hypothetical protein
MKLTEETNYFLLGWSVVPQTKSYFPPDLVDSALPVHQSDQEIGGWSEALESPCGMILKNIPEFPSIVVPMNLRVAPEARLQCSHTIPGWTVKGSGHTMLYIYRQGLGVVSCWWKS